MITSAIFLYNGPLPLEFEIKCKNTRPDVMCGKDMQKGLNSTLIYFTNCRAHIFSLYQIESRSFTPRVWEGLFVILFCEKRGCVL